MAIHRGPSIIRDNLAFGYNSDINSRYFKGEPTTNVHPYPLDIYAQTTSANSLVISRDYDTGKSPVGGIPIKCVITGNDPYIATYNTYLADLIPGETWTFSVYAKVEAQEMRIQLTFIGRDSVGALVESYQEWIDCDIEWTRIEMTRTFSNPNVVDITARLDCEDIDSYIGYTTWFDGYQVEKKDYATPFVSGSRNATSSILNLNKSATTLDVTNISFSSGAAYFDGTNDYMTYSTITLNKDASTFMFWMKPYEIKNMNMFGVSSGSGTVDLIEFRQNYFYCETHSNCNFFSSPTFTTFIANDWHFITVVFDTSYSYWYVDGEYIGETSNYGSINCGTATTSLYDNTIFSKVGSGAYGAYFHGEIPLVLKYDSVLTDQQIFNTYNMYKGKYSNN